MDVKGGVQLLKMPYSYHYEVLDPSSVKICSTSVGPYRINNHVVEICTPSYDQSVLNIDGVWFLKGTD